MSARRSAETPSSSSSARSRGQRGDDLRGMLQPRLIENLDGSVGGQQGEKGGRASWTRLVQRLDDVGGAFVGYPRAELGGVSDIDNVLEHGFRRWRTV